ncbi:MAG: hypothetical protein ACYDBB_15205 [Armatimonadota bacterium]
MHDQPTSQGCSHLPPDIPPLRHAATADPWERVAGFTLEMLCTWYCPAERPACTWSIMLPSACTASSTVLVREVCDLYPSTDFVANAEVHEDRYRIIQVLVPLAELSAILECGRTIRLPIIGIEKMIGYDGETLGIEWPDPFSTIRLQWWCSGPAGWGELDGWVRELQAFLRTYTRRVYDSYL